MDNKYFNSKSVEVRRSQIKPASYNPRTISDEGRKQLKRSIKRYGVVGGIVVNQATGYTIVGGHQKVSVLDELNKYNEVTHENDYTLRVELINVDEKTEKSLNIALNNPNIGGQWDYDALARLVPDIDYKDAGLTDADLNMIGCGALEEMMQPVTEQKEAEKAARQLERAEKVAHMKDVKQQVKEQAQETAANMDAYLMLSFDTWEAKAAFCERFGYDPYMKIVKGEVFDNQVERVE